MGTFEILLFKSPAQETGSNLINLDPTGRRLQHLAKTYPSPREPRQLALSEHLSSASEKKNPVTVILPRCSLLFCFKLLECSPTKTELQDLSHFRSDSVHRVPRVFKLTEAESIVGTLGWRRGRDGWCIMHTAFPFHVRKGSEDWLPDSEKRA